jgi:hypothetical protein
LPNRLQLLKTFLILLRRVIRRASRVKSRTGFLIFMELTQILVKERFDYKDGELFWRNDVSKNRVAGSFAGYYHKKLNNYCVSFGRKNFLGHRIIFLWHKGYLPPIIDHKDRNKRNNRIENLREASNSQNSKNTTSRKNSSSKYLGVSFRKAYNKWCAMITIGGKNTFLGNFSTEQDAALAYNKSAEINHKEFANLNIIIWEQ